MDVVKKIIGFDFLKSRFPGLSPYMDRETGDAIFPDDIDRNGNAGEIAMDIIEPYNGQGEIWKLLSGIESSYDLEDGRRVFSFSDLKKRYALIDKRIDESVVIRRVCRKDGDHFIIEDKPGYEELKNFELLDFYDVFRQPSELIRGIEPGKEILVTNKDVLFSKSDWFLLVDEKEEFVLAGGFGLADAFYRMNGMIRTPEYIMGTKVPSTVSLYDINDYIEFLENSKKTTNDGIIQTREELGGDYMLEFLLGNTGSMSQILDEIREGEYVSPIISFFEPLSITSEEVGLLTECEGRGDYKLKARNEHPSAFVTPDERVTVKSESELLTLEVQRREYSDDNSDQPLEGIFKKSQDMVPGKNGYVDLLLMKKSSVDNKSWYSETFNTGNMGNKTIEKVPVFSCLGSDKFDVFDDNVRVLVEYDNGIYYMEDDPEKQGFPDTIIIDDNGKRLLYKVLSGKLSEIKVIEYDGRELPSEAETDSSAVYHLLHNVFSGKIIVGEIDDYMFFSDNDKSWRKYIVPNVVYTKITEKDYVEVKFPFTGKKDSDGVLLPETRYYATTEHKELVCFDIKGEMKLFHAEYVSADIPFREKGPKNENVFDERNIYGGKKAVNYIDKITYGDGTVTFEYIISAVLGTDEGIRFKETYSYRENFVKNVTVDGYPFEYVYNQIDFDSAKITVLNPDWGYLSREYLPSTATYKGNDVFAKGNYDASPSYKSEYYNGIISANEPEINVTFDRGNAAAFENFFKLMECNTFDDLKNYGNDFFGLRKETPLK